MSDHHDEHELLDDTDAAIAVGSKVIEMADRVKDMHAVIPGARATWAFEIEGVRFLVHVTVEDQIE